MGQACTVYPPHPSRKKKNVRVRQGAVKKELSLRGKKTGWGASSELSLLTQPQTASLDRSRGKRNEEGAPGCWGSGWRARSLYPPPARYPSSSHRGRRRPAGRPVLPAPCSASRRCLHPRSSSSPRAVARRGPFPAARSAPLMTRSVVES